MAARAPFVFPQTVLCRVLIGRDDALESVRAALGRARSGLGGVLVVSGEAGIGKTRLFSAMRQEAREDGFLVLEGLCLETERAQPYSALADLVRAFAAATSPAVVHALSEAVPELLLLFPELGSLFPQATPARAATPERDRRRLYHALGGALQQLAHTQPVLLIFEDVHCSDDALLDLLLHLARSMASCRGIVALSYREEEVGARLGRLLGELDRLRIACEIALRPLRREETERMLREILGDVASVGQPFVTALHEITEGNPFFVEEILKGLVNTGELEHVPDGTWRARPLERVHVPRTAVEAVRRRLSPLSEGARELAAVAAVAGLRFDFDLLQAVTSLPEAELLRRVRELLDAQLVVEESADLIAFRHALTREAIYGELLGRERVKLHRALAAALESPETAGRNGQVEALAYHTFEGGEWAKARRYAAQAAEHALALYAPGQALAQLERALTAAEREGVPAESALLEARGRARETLGDFEGACADFMAMLERARAEGAPERVWRALHALGMLWAARDYALAGEYRAQALTLARELGDPALTARSLNRVGNWHVNLDQPGPALRIHEEALALFRELGDARGEAETIDLMALVRYVAGAGLETLASHKEAVSLFTGLGDRRGIARGLAFAAFSGPSLLGSATVVGNSSLAREMIARERPARLATEIGWRAGEAFCRWVLADCLAWRGRYERALPLAHEALTIAREIDHLEWQCNAERVLGNIALDLLDAERARQRLARAHDIALQLGSRSCTRWSAAPLAVALARLGEVVQAGELLATARESAEQGRGAMCPTDADVPTLGERHLALAAAEVALVAGRSREALRLLNEQVALEERVWAPRAVVIPRLTLLRGMALAATGCLPEAAKVLSAGLEEAAEHEGRPLLWRGQAALARVHLRLGHRLDARRAFGAAREIAGELEASVADEALRASFARGVSGLVPPVKRPSLRQAARAAYGGLTRREREVARLVAAGRSNRAIARALGIGERTVEDHVSHALARLGYSSRAQLAAWCVEKGMAEAPPAR